MHEFWVGGNCLHERLTRERLLTESAFNVIQYLSVRGIGFVQDAFQGEVRRSESVTEVLCKDPATVYCFFVVEKIRRELVN